MKLTKKVPEELALKLYRQAIESLPEKIKEQGECVKKVRGNPKARILLIAPPCTPAEVSKGVPFCAEAGATFHGVLKEHGLDTQQHFLVVSASAYGTKPNKHSTDVIKEYIRRVAQFNIFDLYVCVGGIAFKYIFGQGKKPSSNTLFGSTVFVPDTGFKPLFIFPEPSSIVPPSDTNLSEWEYNKACNIVAANLNKYHAICRKFKQTLKTHKISLK